MNITGEQVKEAMIAANITYVPHHECGGCGCMVSYQREGEQLIFDPRCGCTSLGYVEPRSWQSAADWINMQSNPDAKQNIAKRFGVKLPEPVAA